ncbi:GNAT family N-acetyltransferase [Labilibaculum antarcticum]|nr:GNAT family N-acetyltransferase [Labilibaculum antarcticum]
MIDTSMEIEQKISVISAGLRHYEYAQEICDMIESAAKIRGTGIAKREALYIVQKIQEGKAIIAFDQDKVIGFCYIETWEHGKYVANSGLIVDPNYRAIGLAKMIKAKAFELSRKRYPEAKIFGLTTSLPVMKINSELGYRPVTFSELTTDDTFWKGCSGCVNYDILQRTNQKMCLCTGMLYDPNKKDKK